MTGILRRIYSTDRMVRPDQIRGELIETKDAYKTIITMALPSVIELVFMSMIGAVDTIMVGRLGPTAIAAVGLPGQPRMIVLSLFFALNIGVTAIVARRKGQNRQEDANRTLRNAMVLGFSLSLVMMAVALIFARPLILLAGAKEDTIGMATDYFRIMSYFLPINALTMCINAAQRGVGNMRTPLITSLVANIVNIVFDIFLIYGFELGILKVPAMGVAGDAWASGIGYCVGFALCLFSLYRGKEKSQFLGVSRSDNWRLDKETLKSIASVGGNAMWEQAGIRIGFFMYAAIIARLGTEVLAAHTIAMQFLGISFNIGDGIGVAGTSLVGQSLGRERPDLSVIYGKCSQRIALTVSIFTAMLIIVCRYPLPRLFLDPGDGENVYLLAVNLMFMVAAFQPVQTSSVVISGCLRGAGDNRYVSIVMAICVVIIRPVLSSIAIYALHLGIMGAWGASILDTCTRLTLVYRRFNGGKWHDKKI